MYYRISTYLELRDKNIFLEMCRIHNKAFTYDTVDTYSFLNFVTKDPNAREDLIYVAIDGKGHVLGFLVGVDISKEPIEAVENSRDTIWVKDFAVDPDLDRDLLKNIQLDLMKFFLNSLDGLGKKKVILYAYAPFYFMPGVNVLYEDYIEFFEELGFKKISENVNYEVDLTQFYYPRRIMKIEEAIRSKGITIRRGSESDEEAIVKWVKEAFGNPFWGVETLYAFRNNPPSILLAETNNEFIGFAVYNRMGRNEFGPIGVDEKFRGLGIGSVLLFRALSEMKLAGHRYSVVTWTTHLFFYTQVPGITRIKHYLIMSLEV